MNQEVYYHCGRVGMVHMQYGKFFTNQKFTITIITYLCNKLMHFYSVIVIVDLPLIILCDSNTMQWYAHK